MTEIIDLIDVLPNNPNAAAWKPRPLESITRLVLHHAASSEQATNDELNRIHHGRGWWRLAYHYTISPTGQIFKVNKATHVTFTVKGGNTPTLSVCLIGNRELIAPPTAQWLAAVDLFRDLIAAYGEKLIYGHQEVPTDPPQATACPGRMIDMKVFREDVLSLRG